MAYVYIYNNFGLIELEWNNPVVWYMGAISVDFCYYWVHRACHGKSYNEINASIFIYRMHFSEIHILWAQHQVHHSSEEFNLTVGLRQSILQGWCGFVSTLIT